jgi:hypothetical protein
MEEGASFSKGRDHKKSVVVKVGMLGDAQVGKTSMMVKYVENRFDQDYIETLGVNFMEKNISLRKNEITFMIWDLGGKLLPIPNHLSLPPLALWRMMYQFLLVAHQRTICRVIGISDTLMRQYCMYAC